MPFPYSLWVLTVINIHHIVWDGTWLSSAGTWTFHFCDLFLYCRQNFEVSVTSIVKCYYRVKYAIYDQEILSGTQSLSRTKISS